MRSQLRRLAHQALIRTESLMVRSLHLSPSAPPLFIVGPPRCGTTALYLWVMNSWKFSYFPNISKAHPQAPFSYAALSLPFARYAPTLENSYGIVNQPMAPSDGWKIWLRWFKNEYQERLDGEGLPSLATLLRLFEALFRGPFCVRNNVNALRIEHLSELFPDALFLGITRDYQEAAVSLSRAYQDHGTPSDEWWSAGPPDYQMDEFENDLERAVFQILGVEAILRKGIESIAPHNRLLINYGAFCASQDQVQTWIEKAYANQNPHLTVRGSFEPHGTTVRRSTRLSGQKSRAINQLEEYHRRFLAGEHLVSQSILSGDVRSLVQVERGQRVHQ